MLNAVVASSAGIELEPAPIPQEWILDGAPEARAKDIASSRGGAMKGRVEIRLARLHVTGSCGSDTLEKAGDFGLLGLSRGGAAHVIQGCYKRDKGTAIIGSAGSAPLRVTEPIRSREAAPVRCNFLVCSAGRAGAHPGQTPAIAR